MSVGREIEKKKEKPIQIALQEERNMTVLLLDV